MEVNTVQIEGLPTHFWENNITSLVVLDIKDGQWTFTFGNAHQPRRLDPFDLNQNNEDEVAKLILSDLVYKLVHTSSIINPSWVNVPPLGFFQPGINTSSALEHAFGSSENVAKAYDEFKTLLRKFRIHFYKEANAKKFRNEDGINIHRSGQTTVQMVVGVNATGNIFIKTVEPATLPRY